MSELGLVIRGLISLVAGMFLFRELQGSRWVDHTSQISRRALGFAFVGALTVLVITGRIGPTEATAKSSQTFIDYSEVAAAFQATYVPALQRFRKTTASREADPREKAAERLERIASSQPDATTLARRAGVALAAVRKYDAALARIRKIPSGAVSDKERRLWLNWFGPSPPSPDDVDADTATLRSLNLGWWGELATAIAYQRAGDPAAAAPHLREVEQVAAERVRKTGTVGVGMLCVLPQLALVVFLVGQILVSKGVLGKRSPTFQPVGPILWEALILYFALQALPALLPIPGTRNPSASPRDLAAALLVSAAFQVGVVGYLAHRLRSFGCNLSEVGLTLRGWRLEAVVGVGAGLVGTPVALLVAGAAKLLSDRLFPEMSGGVHPLGILTSTSQDPWVLVGLGLTAMVAAPIIEEIFFRGVMFGALRRRFGFRPALWISAIIFAVLHPQLPLGFLPLTALAVAFTCLYEWRQSLVPGMVAHAVNNGLAFVMSVVQGSPTT